VPRRTMRGTKKGNDKEGEPRTGDEGCDHLSCMRVPRRHANAHSIADVHEDICVSHGYERELAEVGVSRKIFKCVELSDKRAIYNPEERKLARRRTAVPRRRKASYSSCLRPCKRCILPRCIQCSRVRRTSAFDVSQ
jgi:hypothetical protein